MCFVFYLFFPFSDTRLNLCSMSLCASLIFSFSLFFPGTCLEALLKDWTARDAACIPSFYDPDIPEQYPGYLSLGSPMFSLSLCAPHPSKEATYPSNLMFFCFFIFVCRVCSGWSKSGQAAPFLSADAVL